MIDPEQKKLAFEDLLLKAQKLANTLFSKQMGNLMISYQNQLQIYLAQQGENYFKNKNK